jgi:DNA-binding transcriptional LysR family regulator
MLRDDEVDLAFLSVTERIQSRGLTLRKLITEEHVAVLPPTHRLARRRRVRLTELAQESFVSFREGARLRELLVYAAAEVGFEPRIAFESNESRSIRSLVSRGLGVAILPRSDAAAPGAPVAVAALIEPALTRDVTLASRARRRHSPAAEEFMALTRSMFTDAAA